MKPLWDDTQATSLNPVPASVPQRTLAPPPPAGFPLKQQVIAVLATLAIIGLAMPNGLLMGLALLSLLTIFALLYWQGQPPLLLFMAFWQWVPAGLPVIYASLNNEPLSLFSASPEHVEVAAALTMLTGVAMAAGMTLGVGRLRALGRTSQWRDEIVNLSTERLFLFALLCIGVSTLCGIAIRIVPPLHQQLGAAAGIAWSGQFLYLAVCIARREQLLRVTALIAINVAIGMTGFFSEFRIILFVLFLAWFTSRDRIRPIEGMVAIVAFALMIFVSAVWSHVKPEFRDFQNGGTGQQIVIRSTGESLNKISELTLGINAEGLADGMERLLFRLSYIDFFGDVIDRVPSTIPHENGGLLGEALGHVFQPRILFPGKAALPSDSERTNYYTGRGVASGDQGTSINIGMAGELYIDAGPILMFFQAALFGLVIGGMYRWLVLRPADMVLWGYAMTIGTFVVHHELNGILKAVGGILNSFAVFACIAIFLTPWVRSFLRYQGHEPERVSQPLQRLRA